MDRKTTNGKKNKYLLPSIIISGLLIVALALLLVVIVGGDDNSISSGNVVGGRTEAAVPFEERTLDLPSYYAAPATIQRTNSTEKLTLSWWTGYDAEETFTVSNMIPGDSVSKEYKLSIGTSRPKALYFEAPITEDSVLSEILEIKIEVDGELLYEGLLRDVGKCEYSLEDVAKSEVTFKLTVSLPTSATNKYAMKSLTADFVWTLEEKPEETLPPSPPDPPVVDPDIEPIKFNNIFLHGEKIIEGDEPETDESFSIVLERLHDDGTYMVVGETTVNGEGSFDLSDALQGITYVKKGLYTFRITERAGDTEGMQYDSSEKVFQILLDDSQIVNGRLELIEIAGVKGVTVDFDKSAQKYTLSVSFTNVYELETETETGTGSDTETEPPITEPDPENVKVIINAENTVSNNEDGAVDNEGFAFVIENVETGEKIIALTDEKGLAEFILEYSIEDVGKTFKYKVYALAGTNDEVQYSAEVYEIEITVTQDPLTKELIAKVKVNGASVDAEDVRLAFSSSYTGEKERELDSLIPAIIITAIILLCEIAALIYKIYRDKKGKVEPVTLASFMSPVTFLGLYVPKWQVVVLIALVVAAVAMLVVDVIYYIRSEKKKVEETTEEIKENLDDIT